MRLCRREFLTLTEFLIVLAIVAMMMGFFAIRLNSAIAEQRFRFEVQKVLNTLRLAQDIMLLLHNDATVSFESGEKAINMVLKTTTPIPELGPSSRVEQHLSNIPYVEIEDSPDGKTKNKLAVDFYSDGFVMSRGILRLATHRSKEQGLQQYIVLLGSPGPITAVSDAKNALDEQKKSLEESQHLTTLTVDEVRQLSP